MRTSWSSSSWTSWPLKMRPIRCPETSVNNYHTTLRNIPEERRSYVCTPSDVTSSMTLPFPYSSSVICYDSFSLLFYSDVTYRRHWSHPSWRRREPSSREREVRTHSWSWHEIKIWPWGTRNHEGLLFIKEFGLSIQRIKHIFCKATVPSMSVM
jgi:hypothetical protein